MTSETALPPVVKPKPESGCLYILGGLAFIPLIGVPFGLFAIVAGIVTWKRGGWKLMLLGAGGIGFTVTLYSALFYFGFVQRGGVYDTLRGQLARQQLGSLVKTIEFHKLQHGTYPLTLNDLDLTDEGAIAIVDVTDMHADTMTSPRQYYYRYDTPTQTYVLFSVGADGVPYTADDILPDIRPIDMTRIGYRIRPLQAQP